MQRMKDLLLPSSAGTRGSISRPDYFSRLPIIETQRLILRPFKMRDCQDVYLYSSDCEVARYVLWDAHRSLSDTRNYLRYMLRLYHDGQPCSWAIVLKETGKVIGSIGYMWLDSVNDSAEVGYSISRTWWNHGLTTEALEYVLREGFTALRLNRIEAQHDLRNPASGRVMQKCGMTQEGILRSRIKNKKEFVDVALYAILLKDFTKMNANQR